MFCPYIYIFLKYWNLCQPKYIFNIFSQLNITNPTNYFSRENQKVLPLCSEYRENCMCKKYFLIIYVGNVS